MVVYRNRAVYLPDADALVLADLHLGRAEASNVDFPLGEREDLVDRLGALLDRFEPGEVVVAGDVLHSFGRVPVAVERSLQSVRETIDDAGIDLVVTPGNHDSQLAVVYDGATVDEYRLDDGTVVCHGHERPDAAADRYLIGHDHPTIEIEGQRRPCYLYGQGVFERADETGDGTADGDARADVLMLPPFNRLIRGVTVNGTHAADLQSPFVRRLDEFHPVLRDEDGDETLRFPPLGKLRSHL
jgi:putative SbcD/Mre11-related phosphoesterase